MKPILRILGTSTLALASIVAPVAVRPAAAAAFVVLHAFDGTDGAGPNGLVQAPDGFFYGSTSNGGDRAVLPDGMGTLFKMDAAGHVTQLHVFHASDGYSPSGLMRSSDGYFYGTTQSGGAPSGGGAGVIFRMDAAGTFTVLHAFVGGFACCDGGSPQGPPVDGHDGFLYGVTGAGGQFRDIDHQGGFGAFYRCDPATGAVTILHSFSLGDGNGIFPNGPIVRGDDGYFYGTTREASASAYRIDAAGNLIRLHQITDSGQPSSGLTKASDGYFYGTTDGPPGTVFRVNSAGQYAVVNRFDGIDGYGLNQGVVQGSDGALYGPTREGGVLDFQGGVLFSLDASGNVAVLHSFTTSAGPEGFAPLARLIQAADGKLYGTTAAGGATRYGTIFSLDPRLAGPVLSVTVAPSVVTAGTGATGTVQLRSPAPTGGTVVTLAATSFGVTVPPTVTVKPGKTTATFPIQTSAAGFTASARIYALVGGEGVRTILSPAGVVGVGDAGTATEYGLAIRSPNPSAGAVDVEYAVPRTAQIRVAVFDVLGRQVAMLASASMPAGRYHARWTADDNDGTPKQGIYFVCLMAEGQKLVRRVVMMR